MIRVNLLRNRVADSAPPPNLGGGATTVGEGSAEKRAMLVKMACVAVFTLALVLYENQNISALNAELNRTQAMVAELETQAQAKAAEAAAIKDVARQAQELEDKLKIIKLLSKLRLREVKTLDFMQSSIPEKVWIKRISYETPTNAKELKDIETGKYQFDGHAVATEDLSEFVKRLEESAYLDEVIIVRNQESTVANRSTVMRDYQFTANVEVKN